VRQAAKSPSFKEAAETVQEMLDVAISPAHLRRLSEPIGREWARTRDQEALAFRGGQLPPGYDKPPAVAAVMLDGGRYQTRAAGHGWGVTDPAWKETKVALCQTPVSPEHARDPQPEPPRKFLEPAAVARLVATMKARLAPGRGSSVSWILFIC
jgi:hypothetical protein